MPIEVRISINTHEIKTLHIGRIRGGTRPDDVNTYIAQWGMYDSRLDWKDVGVQFTHRYGDPIEVCVAKALEAASYDERSKRCQCYTCLDKNGEDINHYVLCPDCGNKRCPKATFHEHACTKSNEPGQPGSRYTVFKGVSE